MLLDLRDALREDTVQANIMWASCVNIVFDRATETSCHRPDER